MIGKLGKLFWFTSTKKLDKKRDKAGIIHHTLANGSLEDIKELFGIYSKAEVKKVFFKGKRGTYDPRVLALLRVIFGIKKINQNKYVKRIY